jgi:hypothetical protein
MRALPFLPMQIRKDGVALNLFTSIATMGTPHDVTVHELRIESFYPADEGTARWFQTRAASVRLSPDDSIQDEQDDGAD